jgi:coenzyme Q-binding protein COQ10
MVRHHIQEHVPYPPEAIYDLVLDVERYPDFIPWCRAARILSGGGDQFQAELAIAFKHIRESYVSRVEGNREELTIHVEMERGPFHHLINDWQFIPQEDGSCLIDFHIDFAFKHRWLEKLIGQLFNRATQKMVHAFRTRADALYSSENAG